MGASNFARRNTSKVFAVLMDIEETFKECSDCGHIHYDFEFESGGYAQLMQCSECDSEDLTEKTEYRSVESHEYNDFKEYLREVAEEHTARGTDFKYSKEEGSDNNRNYPATDVFSLYTSKTYGDIEVEVKITGQIVSGYYEGANLDFRIEIYSEGWNELENGHYVVTEENILEGLFEPEYNDHTFSDLKRGVRKLMLPKAVNWAEKTTKKMKEIVENIFTEVSQPLNVVGTFSNGETIYSK